MQKFVRSTDFQTRLTGKVKMEAVCLASMWYTRNIYSSTDTSAVGYHSIMQLMERDIVSSHYKRLLHTS